jgi:hypothetical protein
VSHPLSRAIAGAALTDQDKASEREASSLERCEDSSLQILFWRNPPKKRSATFPNSRVLGRPSGRGGVRHRPSSLATAPENRSTVYSLRPGRAEVEGAQVTRPKTGPAVDDQATRSANRALCGPSDVKPTHRSIFHASTSAHTDLLKPSSAARVERLTWDGVRT